MKTIVNSLVRDNLHLFLEHFSQLTPEDKYCRFFHTVGPDAIRSWLLETTEVPNEHYFFVEEDESELFIGVAQLSIEKNQVEAEIAISVVPQARGKGVASNLILSAISFGRSLGLKKITFKCELANFACKRLYKSIGFSLDYSIPEDCIVGYIEV